MSVPIVEPEQVIVTETAPPVVNVDTDPTDPPVPSLTERIKANIRYDEILTEQPNQAEQLGEIIRIICNTFTMNYKNGIVRMGDQQENIETVRQVFLNLRKEDILFFFDCFSTQTKEIKNIESFIRTSLFRNHSNMKAHKAIKEQTDKNKAELKKAQQEYKTPIRRNKFANFKGRERDFEDIMKKEYKLMMLELEEFEAEQAKKIKNVV